jgi:hypothetical protein
MMHWHTLSCFQSNVTYPRKQFIHIPACLVGLMPYPNGHLHDILVYKMCQQDIIGTSRRADGRRIECRQVRGQFCVTRRKLQVELLDDLLVGRIKKKNWWWPWNAYLSHSSDAIKHSHRRKFLQNRTQDLESSSQDQRRLFHLLR